MHLQASVPLSDFSCALSHSSCVYLASKQVVRHPVLIVVVNLYSEQPQQKRECVCVGGREGVRLSIYVLLSLCCDTFGMSRRIDHHRVPDDVLSG